MPVTRERSESPFPYNRSRSPSPIRKPTVSKYNENGAGPSKKPKLGPGDFQRKQVEKLLKNPDREVAMPQASQYKPLKPPPEMVKNINGSASGAGSGEFHVYKHARKREHERLKQMEQKAKDLEEQQEFQNRRLEREAVADAKTAKNRAKRLKRKQGGKSGKNGENEGVSTVTTEATDPKRKLAGGGIGVIVNGTDGGEKRDQGVTNGGVGENESDDGEESGPVPPQDISKEAVVAKEAEIVIHDDD